MSAGDADGGGAVARSGRCGNSQVERLLASADAMLEESAALLKRSPTAGQVSRNANEHDPNAASASKMAGESMDDTPEGVLVSSSAKKKSTSVVEPTQEDSGVIGIGLVAIPPAQKPRATIAESNLPQTPGTNASLTSFGDGSPSRTGSGLWNGGEAATGGASAIPDTGDKKRKMTNEDASGGGDEIAAFGPPAAAANATQTEQLRSGAAAANVGGAAAPHEPKCPKRKLRRSRLVWTPELHARFVNAVNDLGIEKSAPKIIMQLMNVEGLSRENVASHLQKYRIFLKKNNSGTAHDPTSSINFQKVLPVCVTRDQMGPPIEVGGRYAFPPPNFDNKNLYAPFQLRVAMQQPPAQQQFPHMSPMQYQHHFVDGQRGRAAAGAEAVHGWPFSHVPAYAQGSHDCAGLRSVYPQYPIFQTLGQFATQATGACAASGNKAAGTGGMGMSPLVVSPAAPIAYRKPPLAQQSAQQQQSVQQQQQQQQH